MKFQTALLSLFVLCFSQAIPTSALAQGVITWENGGVNTGYYQSPPQQQPQQQQQFVTVGVPPVAPRHQLISFIPQGLFTPRHVPAYIAPTEDDSQNFDDSWDSIRTFKLTRPMDAPISVYVESYPYETTLYKRRYVQYVQDALNAWSTALDGRLRYQMTSDPNRAQIKINWQADFAEADQAGETDIAIGHATIAIKTVGVLDNQIRINIMHEMGHALGISGHSQGQYDIMKGNWQWNSMAEFNAYHPHLSNNDIQAIRRLYSPRWHQGEDLYVAIRQEPKPTLAYMHSMDQ